MSVVVTFRSPSINVWDFRANQDNRLFYLGSSDEGSIAVLPKGDIVADMANPDHVALVNRTPDLWNTWRKRDVHTVPDLATASAGGHARVTALTLRKSDLASTTSERRPD